MSDPSWAIVRRAQAFVVEAPLLTPFRIATGQHTTLENVFFTIELANGIRGYGEAAVASHITGESVARTRDNLKKAARACEGEDISDHASFLKGFREAFTGNHAGLAALEMAVLDAWTRARGIPLWKLFGIRPAPLSSDITIVIGTLDEARDAAAAFFRQGFRVFKVKVGRDMDLDLQRVLAVSRVSPQARIIVDVNQAYDAAGTLRFLKALKAGGVLPLLLEQPVPRDDWDGLAAITHAVKGGVLVCADESVKSLADVRRAIRMKAVSAVNIKLMKSGILEAEAIARAARAAGLELMIGAMMESSLAITAAAHLAAGLGGFRFVDLDTTYFLKGPLSRSPYLDGKGCFDLADAGPGIGVVPADRA